MKTSRKPAKLLGGIDNFLLDDRKFDPSPEDVEGVCRFFSLGKLRRYENEKGIIVSHSNFFVFTETDKGRYALKFYPPDEAKTMAIEFAVNRILVRHHFPTPVMHAGRAGKPYWACNGQLAACFPYINGTPAWQQIRNRGTYTRINSALLTLKNILAAETGRIPIPKQSNFTSTINSLYQTSRSLASYDQKKTIDATLQEVLRRYRQNKASFTRRLLHNNISLTNILLDGKAVHILDLSHIREDYICSDLASLAISCLFFEVPFAPIKAVAKNYFTRHGMGKKEIPVLDSLIKAGLIKEYLKNVQREKSIGASAGKTPLAQSYAAHLARRKKFITAVLKKMNANPRLIV